MSCPPVPMPPCVCCLVCTSCFCIQIAFIQIDSRAHTFSIILCWFAERRRRSFVSVQSCVCVSESVYLLERATTDTEFNYAKSFASLFLYTNIVKKITQVIAELLSVILIKMQTSAFAFWWHLDVTYDSVHTHTQLYIYMYICGVLRHVRKFDI